jgi:hypothetical protein
MPPKQAWLEKAFEERSHWLVWLRLDPRWNSLRGDSRFDALVQRMNYPAWPLPFLFQQLHKRPQHLICRRRDSERRSAPNDQAVEVVDLRALAASQVLRGR